MRKGTNSGFFQYKQKEIRYKNNNLDTKDFNKTSYENAKDIMKHFGEFLGPIYEKAADMAGTGVDIINNKQYEEFKFYNNMDMIDKFKELHNSTNTDIEMFEKALQQE